MFFGYLCAHPHVWVEVSAGLTTHSDTDSLSIVWKYDEMFSLMLSEDFDTDKNGVLSAEEEKNLRDLVFENLKNVDFYMNIRRNTTPYTIIPEFTPRLEEGVLYFVFTFPLPHDTETVRIRVIDEEFYHSMEWSETPLTIRAGDDRSISYDTEMTEVEWFHTLVPVTELVISCE
jgi:ABC-type uncharacterized transport system substrate-binding protein